MSFALGLAGASAAARADDWYAGVGIGKATLKGDSPCAHLHLLDSGFSCSADNTAAAGKLFLGYQVNRNAAVEFSYIDFGHYTADASGTISGVPATATGDAQAHGFDLSVVGIMPVNNAFSILGRLGVLRWAARTDVTADAPGASASEGESITGTDLTLGVGVQYDISKTAGVRVEWTRLPPNYLDLVSLDMVFRLR